MNKSDWGALLASAGAAAAMLFAVWPGGMIEDGVQKAANNPQWFFTAHFVAGTLGILAILIAHRGGALPRLLLGVGALMLLSMLVTEPFHFINIFANVLPALAMTAGAILLRAEPITTSQSTGPAGGRV